MKSFQAKLPISLQQIRMNPRNAQNSKNSNNNGQSFYEHLDQPEQFPQAIIIGKQDKIQKHLYNSQILLTQEQFITVDKNSKKYQIIYLTNYRIILDKNPRLSIPYGYIQQIKQLQKFLRIILKTGLFFDFHLDYNNKKLQQYIIQGINSMPFCLNFISETQNTNIYDSYSQIQRMRVNSNNYTIFKNISYSFCPTYPLYFLIPKGVQISNLSQVKKCRYYQRIPVMSYYHEKFGIGIWRMAKRRNQIRQEILKFDISYIRSIYGKSTVIQIEQNSYMTKNVNFQLLCNLKLSFFNVNKNYSNFIQNPQDASVRADLYKFFGKWYQQIDKLISLAYRTVSIINEGSHVLLEQTYAFDRVSQILVLAQIIIDPFFRTLKGLSILLEKQFISYGHPFEDRCGFTKNKQQVSPIFVQLLQCIHQMITTHPSSFQYTSTYIAQIAYELYTTKYRNFISKTNDPKKQQNYDHCSRNIWEDLAKKISHYSLQYDRKINGELWQIRRKPSIKQYIIWVEYYDLICKMEGQNGSCIMNYGMNQKEI